jgi:hypothetical protein
MPGLPETAVCTPYRDVFSIGEKAVGMVCRAIIDHHEMVCPNSSIVLKEIRETVHLIVDNEHNDDLRVR